MSCACGGIQSVGNVGVAGLGVNPDGLGSEGGGPALFGTVSGNNMVDAGLGALVGYLVAPKKEDRVFWASIGGVGAAMAGTLGFLGLIGAAIWIRKPKMRAT